MSETRSPAWRGWFAMLVVAIPMVLGQWFASRPVSVPDAPGLLQSISFNPVGRWGNPETAWEVTPAALEADMARAATVARAVRLYSLSYGLDEVPAIAARMGLRVTLGIWVDPKDMARTRREMETAVRLARQFRGTVTDILVGNETILREEMTVAELGTLIDEMRARTGLPISTGDTSGVWGDTPELVARVDFIAAHVLPYWGETAPGDVVARGFREYDEMRAKYPGKRAEISEFGWPSGRLNRGASQTSILHQATIVRTFVIEATRRGETYNIVEAFDQPWKINEGPVGPYWGMFDANGHAKFSLTGPVSPDPAWMTRMGAGLLVAFLAGGFWAFSRRSWGEALATAVAAHLAGFAAAWGMSGPLEQYWTTGILLSWTLGVPLIALLAFACFERVREIIDVSMRRPAKVNLALSSGDRLADAPMVSIHVPARGEHPDVLSACLRALAVLDWPRYEVILLLNNTRDTATVEHARLTCEALGERFRFVHEPVLSGFKAGALNRALAVTSDEAEVIAIVDADYVVTPDWLRASMPRFADSNVAAVQFPQEHFGDSANPVRDGMNDEYAGFFDAGMVQRAMDNAIVMHGTMLLLRRADLETVGGWAEDHVCEDTELGLRLLALGKRLDYVPVRMGRGVLPDGMAGFRRQRDRWVYGGMRICVAHARLLFDRNGPLTALQKYHFVGGWSAWWSDAVALVASVGALVWAAYMLIVGKGEPPPTELSVVIIVASCAAFLHTLVLHGLRVRRGWGAAFRAAATGASLQMVVGIAVIRGLFMPGMPFRVTPKGGVHSAFMRRMRDVRLEIVMATAQCVAVFFLIQNNMFLGVTANFLLATTLMVQSLPNLTAVVLSAGDAPRRPRVIGASAAGTKESVSDAVVA